MGKFKEYDRRPPYLIPPSVEEWLPADHLAYFVVDIVERLDLSEIKKCYSYRGNKGYAPEILIGVLFYGYMTGIFSSRKIALIHHVISDITGITGMKIIKALEGDYRTEPLAILKQELELYEFYLIKIEECDKSIKECYEEFDKYDGDDILEGNDKNVG